MEAGALRAVAPPNEATQRPRDLRVAVALFLLAFLVYNANLRIIGAGDSYAARVQPFALWRHGTLRLDDVLAPAAAGNREPYWIQPGRGGHAVSLYPVVTPVLVAPLDALVALALAVRGWPPLELERATLVMEKLSASFVTALACALFYLLVRRRVARRDAIVLTLLLAFATDTWVISSQALWQHGAAELLLVVALLLLTVEANGPRLLAAGAVSALVACNRPVDAFFAVACGLFVLQRRRAQVWWFAAGAVVILALQLSYDLLVMGNLGGGYARIAAGHFDHPLLAGVAGLLVSPTRGLLVFSPFLLLVPLRLRTILREDEDRPLRALLLLAVLGQLVLYALSDWRAGSSFGPRFFTDALPVLVWTMAPAFARLGRPGRRLVLAGGVAGCLLQAAGAIGYQGLSDLHIFADARDARDMRPAWSWRNSPALEILHGRASPSLLHLPTTPAPLAPALAWVASRQLAPVSTDRALLNSERIARRFGSYGVEVLESGATTRIASLYSEALGRRVCRTFAVTLLATPPDPRLAVEDRLVRAGGSIGSVFQQRGWTIEKRQRWVGEIAPPRTGARLVALMSLGGVQRLATDVYTFVVRRPGVEVAYATIAEVYHPTYLRLPDVEAIAGMRASGEPPPDADVRALLALVERAAAVPQRAATTALSQPISSTTGHIAGRQSSPIKRPAEAR